uniref:ATP-dependent helicase Rep n=1 Tax=Cruciviridae sp. TaxID=1955495 RepID=A0A1S6LVG7_9VIRU|nr:replication protein [Cruciviridae sp.]
MANLYIPKVKALNEIPVTTNYMAITHKSRHFLVTIFDNHWGPTILRKWMTTVGEEKHNLPKEIKYFVGSYEMCPSTKRMHWQCYAEFNGNSRSLMSVKTIFECPSANIQNRKGNRDQARHYCMKPVPDCSCTNCTEAKAALNDKHVVVELGSFEKEDSDGPGQGARTDLKNAKTFVLQPGVTDFKMYVEDNEHSHTIAKYYKFFERARLVNQQHIAETSVTEKKEILVIVGPTGTFKSSSARQTAANKNYRIFQLPQPSASGQIWWDGYDNQECVIIDEMSGKFPLLDMLNLTDRYPYMGQVKGGSKYITPKMIIFTANTEPEEWYPRSEAKDRLAPLYRRITKRVSWINDGWGEVENPHKEVEPQIFDISSIQLPKVSLDVFKANRLFIPKVLPLEPPTQAPVQQNALPFGYRPLIS